MVGWGIGTLLTAILAKHPRGGGVEGDAVATLREMRGRKEGNNELKEGRPFVKFRTYILSQMGNVTIYTCRSRPRVEEGHGMFQDEMILQTLFFQPLE